MNHTDERLDNLPWRVESIQAPSELEWPWRLEDVSFEDTQERYRITSTYPLHALTNIGTYRAMIRKERAIRCKTILVAIVAVIVVLIVRLEL